MFLICGVLIGDPNTYICDEDKEIQVKLDKIYTLEVITYNKTEKGCQILLENKVFMKVKQTCGYISKQMKGK